jgi:hypothetical protein
MVYGNGFLLKGEAGHAAKSRAGCLQEDKNSIKLGETIPAKLKTATFRLNGIWFSNIP